MLTQSLTKLSTSWLKLGTIVCFMLSGMVNAEQPFTIAVASNFQLPLQQILAESEDWHDKPLRIVVGSSGGLFAQAIKGAPFDMLLSADSQRPEELVAKGLASAASAYTQGLLVVWPIKNKEASAQEASIQANEALAHLNGKLAIANPELAPFGTSALSFINTLNNAASLKQQLVFASNVSQAFQFVDSGNARIGILAKSSLLQAHHRFNADKYLAFWEIPTNRYSAIIQKLVIFNNSKHQATAQALLDFLIAPSTQIKLQTLGYAPIKSPFINE